MPLLDLKNEAALWERKLFGRGWGGDDIPLVDLRKEAALCKSFSFCIYVYKFFTPKKSSISEGARAYFEKNFVQVKPDQFLFVICAFHIN